MKTEKKESIANYRVPEDLLSDILRIVITNRIKYRIEGVKERERIFLLQVTYPATKIGEGAQDNIEMILNDYAEYMEGMIGDNNLFVYAEEEDEEN